MQDTAAPRAQGTDSNPQASVADELKSAQRAEQKAEREHAERQIDGDSPLTRKELRRVSDNTRLTALTVFSIIRREGEEELRRPGSSLWWSGIAAGIGISSSVYAQALLYDAFAGDPQRALIASPPPATWWSWWVPLPRRWRLRDRSRCGTASRPPTPSLRARARRRRVTAGACVRRRRRPPRVRASTNPDAVGRWWWRSGSKANGRRTMQRCWRALSRRSCGECGVAAGRGIPRPHRSTVVVVAIIIIIIIMVVFWRGVHLKVVISFAVFRQVTFFGGVSRCVVLYRTLYLITLYFLLFTLLFIIYLFIGLFIYDTLY